MRQKIQVAVDPDPDPEATGAFLEDVESENVINDVDSTESMVVVMNSDLQTQDTPSNTMEDETPASVASLRSPAVPSSSGPASTANLKTPTTVQEEKSATVQEEKPTTVEKEKSQELQPASQEESPSEKPIDEASMHDPSSPKVTAQESVIVNPPVEEPLIEKISVPLLLTNEPSTHTAIIEEPLISNPELPVEQPLSQTPLNESLSVPQSLPEESFNQEVLIEKISIPEDLVVGKLSSAPLIDMDKSQEPLTEEQSTPLGKKSVVLSNVLEMSSTSYGEMPIPQDENQNKEGVSENPRRSSMLETSPPKSVSFNPNPIITYPVVVEPTSTTVIDEEKSKPTPTPVGSVAKPLVLPGLLPQPTDTQTNVKPAGNTCPKCGMKIDAADTKLIPNSKIWGLFMVLFCCGFWWLSWFPFLLKCWHEPVEICPFCYRRLTRKAVSSNSVQP